MASLILDNFSPEEQEVLHRYFRLLACHRSRAAAKKCTPEERSRMALNAANARWKQRAVKAAAAKAASP